MAWHYMYIQRESEETALPDLEVFQVDAQLGQLYNGPGWYYWTCFPGCLPDGDPNGPFDTETEALEDARQGVSLARES
jgi:hypothetical protein